MAPNANFKVIIAGAGVAGLALAKMLEKFNIDYLILEAHKDVAPAVGAGIGMLPNGLRILDQIGCYEPILKLPQQMLHRTYLRHPSGKPILLLDDMSRHYEKRHGYPALFFDRQWLLQVLYDQLQNKDRVLLNRRVAHVDLTEEGVRVMTTNGESFDGSLLVGADGVHSAVRAEMARIANQLQPGHFPLDSSQSIACHYKCSFGIAKDVPGFVVGDQNIVKGRGMSTLLISGPENRVYWFIFVRLPEPLHGAQIPRYTEKDEAEFVKKFSHILVTDKMTFGEVYAARITSTFTPLHEYVYSKWFFRRFILIGDSAHKANPIGGQGGNVAIEAAAELVNAISLLKDERPEGLSRLTESDVERLCEQVQSRRQTRAEEIVNGAHRQQALSAYHKPLVSALVWNVVAPRAGEESILQLLGRPVYGGTILKKLYMPNRPRAIPFDDELPAKAIGPRIASVVFFVLFGWMVFLSRRGSNPGVGLEIEAVGTAEPLAGQYTDANKLLTYFATQALAPILLYTVESYRVGNQGGPRRYTHCYRLK
ncbi:fad binding domain protein [Colletotrichum incanum]|uniref:Fad binding domain protein n=1 Tax=Colletotrichum incanum TaxID=1573173 RepID=A0A167DKH9_COLIC|nr:fad binding domain protein [Colletotrichum incanum]